MLFIVFLSQIHYFTSTDVQCVAEPKVRGVKKKAFRSKQGDTSGKWPEVTNDTTLAGCD